MTSVPGINCCPVWYCTASGPVSQYPGLAPVGTTGGPWSSELAAIAAGCAYPPIAQKTLDCGGLPPVYYPEAIDVTFANATGWIAPWLYNTVRVPIAPLCGGGPPTYNNFNPMKPGAPACGGSGGPTFTLRACVGCYTYSFGLGDWYLEFDGFLDGCTGTSSGAFGGTFPYGNWAPVRRTYDFSTPVFHRHFSAPATPLGAYSFDVYFST